MDATRKLLKTASLFAATMVAAACQTGPGATTAPTTAPAVTTAPVATAPATTIAPATQAPASMGIPSGAFAQFTAKAGATPQVQGGATLVGVEGKTNVVVAVLPAGTETLAAAIQAGTCGSLNPEIAYRLTDVVSGASATSLDVDLQTLLATDYAVTLLIPGSETESSVACGNIEPVIQ